MDFDQNCKMHCWEMGKSQSIFCDLHIVSVHYLLNQWMDFDKTCIDTLLGRVDKILVTLTLF